MKSQLKAGADGNTTDHDGNTAAMSGNVTCIKALLDSGANTFDETE